MSSRLLLILGAAVAIVTVATGLYWKGRSEGAARERPKIEAARAQAAVAGLETEGARASAQRVDLVIRQRNSAADAVAHLTAKALTSEDANAPLGPDRTDRLRRTDSELCLAAPDLAGCSTGGDAR
jgi:hypothetical protein